MTSVFRRKPLHYQSSECDCVPTSVINALLWMFHDIHPEIIRSVWDFTLDGDGSNGTSYARQEALFTYLNIASDDPCDFKGFGVVIEGTEAPSDKMAKQITKCLRAGGCVLTSVWYGKDGHMSLILGEDPEYYYCFDSYWRQNQWNDDSIEWSPDGFFNDFISNGVAEHANTRVKKSRFLSKKDMNYSVGKDSVALMNYAEHLFKKE